MEKDKGYEFYKKFYDENRISMLQYNSLRKHFQELVATVMGDGYYNMAMDVYECDRICCEDIAHKARGFWAKLFGNK